MEILTPKIEPAFSRSFTTTSSGKVREIWVPNQPMHDQQRFMLRTFRKLGLEVHAAATGSMEGCSPAKNVEAHAGNRFFYQLDFSNAYGQVDIGRLAYMFSEQFEFKADEVEGYLQEYCTVPERPGLVIGAATSPLLFNYYCSPLDDAIAEYTEPKGIAYTRYLDDLTFSSPSEINGASGDITTTERREIREIVDTFGMVINPNKTRVSDIEKAPVVITGLQLNRHGNWQLTNRFARRAIRELKYSILKYGISDERTHDLAAGYKGVLVASRQSGRKASELLGKETQLRTLVDNVLLSPHERWQVLSRRAFYKSLKWPTV